MAQGTRRPRRQYRADAHLQEELSRAGTIAPYIGSGITLLGPTLIQWGSEEQKGRFIPKILNAEEIWCQGYSEPNAGSDLAALQTRAVEDGDEFVVNGSKIWTSNAHYSDWIFLLVRTDPQAPKHKGISYLLVDMKTPGVTVRPLVQMTGAQGFNQVFFEDVRVPRRNLVGQKNQGWQVAMTTLGYERTGGHHRGLTRQVYELAQAARQLQRNGGSAWDDSNVRQEITRFAIEAQAIKYTSIRQLTRELKGLPPGPRRIDPETERHRAGAANRHVRDGTAGAIQPARPWSRVRTRRRPLVASDARGARSHDLCGY